ncbi:MAG: carboxypeptidase-like regulatory domain-containing protein [Bacteroidia bacterium]
MKLKSLIILLIAFVSVLQLKAQKYIHGVVVDAEKGEPIPFVNVVLKGSFKGTATNFDGEFTLNIPEDAITDTVLMTVVGYKKSEYLVSEYLGEDFHRFEIAPFVYEIEDITVEVKSTYANTIIKNAADAISKNYHQGAFNYDMYYRNTQQINGKVSKERQAAVKLYDAKGYEQANAFTAYKDRGYEFMQVRRNFEQNSLSDRTTQLDDLLEFDIVRNYNNVLNALYIYDEYEVDIDAVTQLDGDSVWVIKFKCLNPRLGLTGDNYSTAYSGKIYIKKKDYAVVKYEATYECSNYSSQGRSLYVNESKQESAPVSIVYTVTTRYQEYGGIYFLSSVQYNRKHKWKHKNNNSIKKESIEAQLLVTDIEVKNPKPIEKRAYYEEIPFNKKFWESFNYLKDEKNK